MTSNSYSLPLLPCFGLLFLMSSLSLTFGYRSSKCNNATTYADGSTYSINVRRVLDHLVDNGSLTGFGTYSYGQSPNKVYGLLQCIGNITQEKCQSCAGIAESQLQERCRNDIGGQVWMNYCFLRYSNSSFFSQLDTAGRCRSTVNDVKSQNLRPSRNITFGLLSNLINMAIDSAGFALGSSSYTLSNGVSGDVYGLVQCWRDLSNNDCQLCFSSAMKGIEYCCSNQGGAQAMLGSCIIRFELYPFYFSNKTQATPSSAANSPAPSKAEGLSQETSGSNLSNTSLLCEILDCGTCGCSSNLFADVFL